MIGREDGKNPMAPRGQEDNRTDGESIQKFGAQKKWDTDSCGVAVWAKE